MVSEEPKTPCSYISWLVAINIPLLLSPTDPPPKRQGEVSNFYLLNGEELDASLELVDDLISGKNGVTFIKLVYINFINTIIFH